MLISYCGANQTLLITAQSALGTIEILSGKTENLKPFLTEAFHSKTQTLLFCDNVNRTVRFYNVALETLGSCIRSKYSHAELA